MKGRSYNKILLPIDLEMDPEEVISKGLDLSRHTGATLIILHAYRLIMNSHNHPMSSNCNIKTCLESKAINLFKKLEQQVLQNSSVPYRFFSEVGFISDRIVANANNQQVEAVLIHPSVAKKIEENKGVTGLKWLKEELGCPIIYTHYKEGPK